MLFYPAALPLSGQTLDYAAGVIRPGRKHRKHGMNLQVIASPDGDIVWVSGPLPGAVHDLTAARIWGCHDGLDGNRPRPHPETDR